MISPASVLCVRTFGLLILGLQPLYSTAVFAADERQHFSIDAARWIKRSRVSACRRESAWRGVRR